MAATPLPQKDNVSGKYCQKRDMLELPAASCGCSSFTERAPHEPKGYRELPCIFGPARRPFLGGKMKASDCASFFLLFTALQTCAAPAAAADPPADIGRFVEPGTKLLSVHAADLNGDG